MYLLRCLPLSEPPACIEACCTFDAGALVAGVVFGLVDDRGKFWISAACGIAGVFVTFIMIPDITTLDLKEGDKRWLAIVSVSAQCWIML